MHKVIFIISSFIILSSCYEQEDNRFVNEERPFLEQTPETDESDEDPDEKEIQTIPEIFQKTDLIDFPILDLPFKLDEGDMESLKTHGEFTFEQLRYISQNFAEEGKNDDFYLQESKRIYDLKSKGKYDDYVAGLDLAQLRDATAHPIGRFDKGNAQVLLWVVDYSSFEACPFYAGRELMVSVLENDEIQTSRLIATENSGGDPPAFGETTAIVEIDQQLEVKVKSFDRVFEDDDLIESKETKQNFTLNW